MCPACIHVNVAFHASTVLLVHQVFIYRVESVVQRVLLGTTVTGVFVPNAT